MRDTAENINIERKKAIGLFGAVSIGVGGMIGAGIFSVLGLAAQIAGNAMYLAFLTAGIVAFLSTYSFAKLGVRYPSAGGPVEFLIKGFGDSILSGGLNILLWIGYIFALCLYSRAFAGYATTFLPSGASRFWINIFSTGIIIVFTAINIIGSKAVGKSEVFIVGIKVLILIAFASIGVFFIKPSLLSFSNFPHVSNIFFASGIVFLAYEGFGLITNAADDMVNPGKTLPRALYLSVLICIAIYLAVSLTVIGNLPVSKIVEAKDYALAMAARPFLGVVGFKVIAVAALFSTSSAINATLYGGANVSYMIAKEGELPAFFERKLWRENREGLFITAGLVIFFTNLLNLDGIAMLGSASFLIIYCAVNFAHLRLYKETGANPYLIWSSIFGCIFSFVVLIYYEIKNSPKTIIVLVSVLALSFLTECIYRKYSSRNLTADNE